MSTALVCEKVSFRERNKAFNFGMSYAFNFGMSNAFNFGMPNVFAAIKHLILNSIKKVKEMPRVWTIIYFEYSPLIVIVIFLPSSKSIHTRATCNYLERTTDFLYEKINHLMLSTSF